MSSRHRARSTTSSRGGATRGATPARRDRIRSTPTVTSTDGNLDYISRCEKWCAQLDNNSAVENILNTLGEFQVMVNKDQMSRMELSRLVLLFNQPQITENTFQTILSLNDLFCVLVNSKFVTSKFNLLRFLVKTLDDLQANSNTENLVFILNNITSLLGNLMNKFPNEHCNYSHCISRLFERIESENFEEIIPFYDREYIYELNFELSRITISEREIQIHQDNYAISFRAIEIFPNYNEIEFPSNTELKALIREGQYEDTESYLDIHFKLLREDMIYPLKVAINFLIQLDENYATGLFTYDNVKIAKISTLPQHGLVYRVTFTPYGMQNIKSYNWERSDRLKYGSLLCLSKKNIEGYPTFKDPLWAIVINKETQNRFCTTNNKIPQRI
ncbi:NFX1-type zinc finger-containing protein 1 [Oopsacas minuta]|uniref:NFX1-type zinc finger-containing protein 1 n=1 Tax=Oopsacas minuta TaxID=111878 RepID=A0AAV7JEW6_9METZ|nr:NFX1-type zinc finger-containing protein 1 [Oopsacas minuta]